MKTRTVGIWRDAGGQSVLEYAAIQMLIVLAIVLMGPYVIRSVNAFFRGAEEQIQDSYQEEIVQAPLEE